MSFLNQVDEIIMFEDGLIVGNGTYDELISSNSKFSKFMNTYFSHEADDEDGPTNKTQTISNRTNNKLIKI